MKSINGLYLHVNECADNADAILEEFIKIAKKAGVEEYETEKCYKNLKKESDRYRFVKKLIFNYLNN